MATLNLGRLAFDELRTSRLARPAVEKFAGAWVACLLVMARGNIFVAFSLEHLMLATVCGMVGAVVTVALLLQMNRTTNSLGRQVTLSAVVTLIGDVFAHPSHFGPGARRLGQVRPPQWRNERQLDGYAPIDA